MCQRFLFHSLFVFCCIFLISASHKFYVSITQIDVNEKSQKLEISVRIFTDDLEASIFEETHEKLHLGSENENPRADSILFHYIVPGLGCEQDDKDLMLKYIGNEVEADVTWIYLESWDGIHIARPLLIRNGLLYERFPEQKNIVNLRYNKKTSSEIHTKSHTEYTYQIERN